IAYEIYSAAEESNAEPVVHSQGSAVLSFNGKAHSSEVPTLDLAALEGECRENSFSPTQCYEAFRAMGIDYGPGHQGIEEVHVGRGQVLAKLSLPVSVVDTQEQYILHPSLMDSALQAAIGLMMGQGDGQAALPFALQELKIFGRCSSTMWAFIRSRHESAGDKVQKLDIDVCDETGKISVSMKGFNSRMLPGEAVPGESGLAPLVGTLMLTPVWDVVSLEKGPTFPLISDEVVIIGGTQDN